MIFYGSTLIKAVKMFTYKRLKRNDKAIQLANLGAESGFLYKTPQGDLFNEPYLSHLSWQRSGDTRDPIKHRDQFLKLIESQEDIVLSLRSEGPPLGGLAIGRIEDIDSTWIVYHLIKDPV